MYTHMYADILTCKRLSLYVLVTIPCHSIYYIFCVKKYIHTHICVLVLLCIVISVYICRFRLTAYRFSGAC